MKTLCFSSIALVLTASFAAAQQAQVFSEKDAPAPGNHFKLVKEGKGGTNLQLVLEDESGLQWRAKLGSEAKPETAASCLVRLAGFAADIDYYRAEIPVDGIEGMPELKDHISPGGLLRGVRLEHSYDGAKSQNWRWSDSKVAAESERNRLRIMMALVNNWDLKDSNNRIDERNGKRQLVVSDLGASFGKTGDASSRSKGNLQDFENAKFVRKINYKYVDLVMNSRPMFVLSVLHPKYYFERAAMEKVTKKIPLDDAVKLGEDLDKIPQTQIRQCFQDAGFSAHEVEGFTRVILQRIDTLKWL